jgi:membrane associated rhomboid family serine protease
MAREAADFKRGGRCAPLPIRNAGTRHVSFYRQGPYRPMGAGFAVPGLTPWVKRIVIASVAVWLVQWVSGRLLGVPLEGTFGLVPAKVVHGFVYQPVTYMFLHSPRALFHLLFNMLMLWMFGSELESLWGGRAFARFYLVCGLGAAVFITALGLFTEPHSVTIGASGAIYGLIMAYGTVFAQRTILFMMIFPMKARTFAWIFFVVAFISTVDPGASGVSHVAHLGGAVTGFLFLKRAWRVGSFYRELRWKLRRRRFKVMTPEDPDDRWIH